MATAIAPLSFKVFEKALNSALDELQKSVKISKLTEPQSRSAFNFLSGNDTFVSLPTGHGKSLIYQICPMIVLFNIKRAPFANQGNRANKTNRVFRL